MTVDNKQEAEQGLLPDAAYYVRTRSVQYPPHGWIRRLFGLSRRPPRMSPWSEPLEFKCKPAFGVDK